MPGRIFMNAGFVNWTPSADGMADDTVVRMHASGKSGVGGTGGMSTAGGGGGGERRGAEVTLTNASEQLDVNVGAEGWSYQTYISSPTNGYLVRAVNGSDGDSSSGGAGGTGGDGALLNFDGGAGGWPGTVNGGGGGGGGGDGAAGNAGADGDSGGAGGAGQTQFGVASSGGGGQGADATENGVAGSDWGGGGGGGTIVGSPGAYKPGIVLAVWGASLELYPTTWVDGYFDDPVGGGDDGVLLLSGDDDGFAGVMNAGCGDIADGYG